MRRDAVVVERPVVVGPAVVVVHRADVRPRGRGRRRPSERDSNGLDLVQGTVCLELLQREAGHAMALVYDPSSPEGRDRLPTPPHDARRS